MLRTLDLAMYRLHPIVAVLSSSESENEGVDEDESGSVSGNDRFVLENGNVSGMGRTSMISKIRSVILRIKGKVSDEEGISSGFDSDFYSCFVKVIDC